MLRLLAPLCAAAILCLSESAFAQDAHAGHDAMAMPTSGLRAELIQDLDQLETKYVGLAAAMAGKYDWKPGEGVRSAGAVFMHVANANLFLSTIVGMPLPEEFQGADVQASRQKLIDRESSTDAQAIDAALKQAFAQVRHAIASVPDDQLDAPVKLFGQDATKRRVLTVLVTHMHEHLGQAIAYARASGVTPPWSE